MGNSEGNPGRLYLPFMGRSHRKAMRVGSGAQRRSNPASYSHPTRLARARHPPHKGEGMGALHQNRLRAHAGRAEDVAVALDLVPRAGRLQWIVRKLHRRAARGLDHLADE